MSAIKYWDPTAQPPLSPHSHFLFYVLGTNIQWAHSML